MVFPVATATLGATKKTGDNYSIIPHATPDKAISINQSNPKKWAKHDKIVATGSRPLILHTKLQR